MNKLLQTVAEFGQRNAAMIEAFDAARMACIRHLYSTARDGTAEEFVKAFDQYDARRAREIECWRKLATDAINCRTRVTVLPASIQAGGE